MPVFTLRTNVKVEDPKTLILELSKLGVELTGKPESFMAVDFTYNENISFAGTFEPAFLAICNSIEDFSPEANINLSKRFFDYIAKKLDVPDSRAYIGFQDIGAENIGFRSTTLAEMLKVQRAKQSSA